MKLQANARGRTLLAFLALALITIGQIMWAQNLGSAPASNVAVQGQTGAQPEGAFLNFINWVGNVIAPVVGVSSDRRFELCDPLRSGATRHDSCGVLCPAGHPGYGGRRAPTALSAGSAQPADLHPGAR